MDDPDAVNMDDRDANIRSMKTTEEGLRRRQATSWLVEIFGPIGIPDHSSEQEFIAFFKNDFVICKLLHELRPDSFAQPAPFTQIKGEASSSTNLPGVAHFKNVDNFISLMNELKFPAPEASIFSQDDFKEGASKNLVDCILGAKNYLQKKQVTTEITSEPNQEPQNEPETQTESESEYQTGLESQTARAPTWEWRFMFAKRMLYVVSWLCSIAAGFLCLPVDFSVEDNIIHLALLSALSELGTFAIVVCLPGVMRGQSHFIKSYIPKKRPQMRNILIWATRIAILLMSSLTMWLSTVIKPVEKYGKIVVAIAGLLLTSAVLCEASNLNDSGSGGVIELMICFILVQVTYTFHLKLGISLGISFLCYIQKELVMFAMRGMEQKVKHVKEEETRKKEEKNRAEEEKNRAKEEKSRRRTRENNVKRLKELRFNIDHKARTRHRINVEKELPELNEMTIVLNGM